MKCTWTGGGERGETWIRDLHSYPETFYEYGPWLHNKSLSDVQWVQAKVREQLFVFLMDNSTLLLPPQSSLSQLGGQTVQSVLVGVNQKLLYQREGVSPKKHSIPYFWREPSSAPYREHSANWESHWESFSWRERQDIYIISQTLSHL